MRAKIIGFAALLIASAVQASAQDCSQILRYGIWETRDLKAIDITDQSFANTFCSRVQKSEGASINVIGYGDGAWSKKSKEQVCHTENGQLRVDKSIFDSVRKASEPIVRGWSECMNNTQGSHAGLLQGSDLNRFSIIFKRKDRNIHEIANVIISPPASCTLEGGKKFEGSGEVPIPGETTVPCERITQGETTVTVNFVNGAVSQQLYVPAVPTAPPVPTFGAKIVRVSVPPDSSDGPTIAGKLNVAQFPVRDQRLIGIGFIVEPESFIFRLGRGEVVMHDHKYKDKAKAMPDPDRAQITYYFDKPARVSEVLVLQHANGVAEIEGWVGSRDGSGELSSIGRARSSLWTGKEFPVGLNRFSEGFPDVFRFEAPGEGTVFRFVITRTSANDGFAFYRAYPRDTEHRPIQPTISP